MTKVKALDRSLYPSISDAIYEIMDKHLLVAADNPIYGGKALSEVLFFLCENNILHQYTIIPAPAGAECDEIISLVWIQNWEVKEGCFLKGGGAAWQKELHWKFYLAAALV